MRIGIINCGRARRRTILGRVPGTAATLAACVLLAASLAGCGGDDKGGTKPTVRHPQDFLPQQVGSMTRDGGARTATTATELQAVIDGGYQTYTNHDFREFVEQKYQGSIGGTQTLLTAWIFEMAAAENAIALHADEQVQTGNCQERHDLGDQERLCLGFGSQTLQIRRDKYWIRLFIDSDSQDAEQLLGLFGAAIDEKIRS